MLGSFFWHSEISIFYPQMKYFFKNVNMEFSKMAVFWGVRSEIDFERKPLYGYVLYAGFVLKLSIRNFS